MHPTELTDEKLLSECDVTRQRRSGPGGQHRNKVETAIRIEHRPTGVTGQASERRSQEENRKVALFRLRVELALKVRSSPEVTFEAPPSARWMNRVKGGKLAINPKHDDFPALLAEGLDRLHLAGWDHKAAAEQLQLSASQLIKFLKLEPVAFAMLNDYRDEHGLKPLS
ncbi:peptide chain release factor family protein [Rubinisphaera brasiliensis]|uniref:Class I peptide chain release factor n=1 Tax=Rubinisphaera brasiliensis (strain ATCC 49424 / DSM 5305 / JCM 21570 / IAM 15109 / NBRC 103401 / IFAM 1448) TaxID=756272 RepID=F0SFV6_RUBBR|nr:Class I peptide chain release factor [Rubinisphaera brasiliensis DSM 5305]